MGYLTYKRTYARQVPGENRTEEWPETVDRVIRASYEQLKVPWEEGEPEQLRDVMLGLKGSVAGRFLWQLGTETVAKLGLPSLMNCAGTVVNDAARPWSPFCWTFDFLMLGSGVGFNLQRENVYKLPRINKDFVPPIRQDNKDADFILPDTREGWTELLSRTLRSAFGDPDMTPGFTYSTQLVRGNGAPIKGFGGTASGPEILCEGIENISNIISARRGQYLRPIDCLDILNIIASVVVAGNVRRSAEIALGDYDDSGYMQSKRWDLGTFPTWRNNSNNSVVCSHIDQLPDAFWEGYVGNGEPFGLINLRLTRLIGRTGDTRYPDPNVVVFNPCAEQPLEDRETCCLAEVFLPNIESIEEMKLVVKLLYKMCKHSLTLPCKNSKETEAVVHKNMRMGIGVTGYLAATEEQRSWLSEVYEYLRAFDAEYSKQHGLPVSIKLTTVKPSGTLSLLPAGITPGCHPGYAKYMIRRIRIAADHPLVDVCRDSGYHVEYLLTNEGKHDYSTCIVEFPYSYPAHAITAGEMSAIDQLEVVRRLQRDWSDNAVSCTVYYRKEELPEIKEYLRQYYADNFKSISFLLHQDHGFKQAPFEEITKEQYDELVARTKLIDSLAIDTSDLEFDISDCEGGACPVR